MPPHREGALWSYRRGKGEGTRTERLLRAKDHTLILTHGILPPLCFPPPFSLSPVSLQKVANVLLRKGRMPVGQIANITLLKPRQVRECLFVLIQHNIAVYAQWTERDRIMVYYEINRPELLHRALLPKVLYYAQRWFGNEGGLIAQSLLKHGKLTIMDCTNDVLTTLTGASRLVGKSKQQRK